MPNVQFSVEHSRKSTCSPQQLAPPRALLRTLQRLWYGFPICNTILGLIGSYRIVHLPGTLLGLVSRFLGLDLIIISNLRPPSAINYAPHRHP